MCGTEYGVGHHLSRSPGFAPIASAWQHQVGSQPVPAPVVPLDPCYALGPEPGSLP